MQIFVHYKIQKVEDFLAQLSDLNRLFQDKSFQFGLAYTTFNDDLIEYFHQIGDSNNQAEIEQLKNYYEIAQDGIDPVTLEKVDRYRRTLVRKAAFHCLSSITNVLQTEIEKDLEKLEQSRQTMGSLVLSLVQNGVINLDEIPNDMDLDKIKQIWNSLVTNDQIKLHERNLRLQITQEDIYLLFEETLGRIRN